MKKIADDSGHMRGMSDHAPLYALIILGGILGGIASLITALGYLLFKII